MRFWLALAGWAALSGGGAAPARAADAGGWDVKLQVGTAALWADEVAPYPIALGASRVAERGWVGWQAGALVDAATYCEHPDGRDGTCGLLLVVGAGPRLRVPVAGPWVPYLSLEAQGLRMTEGGAWQPALAPRLGLTHRGDSVGFFIEVGATRVFGDGGDIYRLIGVPGEERRWLPTLALGIRLF